MKNITKKIILILTIMFCTNYLITITNAKYINIINTTNTKVLKKIESPNLLIFISPQYKDDEDIINSVKKYITTVKNQVGWVSLIIKIQKENNNFEAIDEIIEQYYKNSTLKACIMVGEDISTALSGDSNYMETPSTVPWYTIGGKKSYETSKEAIVCKPYKIDVCVTLLYPAHVLSYSTKKSQIITVFEKFSNRNKEPLTNAIVFESSEINSNSKALYKNINNYTNLFYKENPTQKELIESLEKNYSMYYIHGHSNPSGTIINDYEKIWFSAENLKELKTPFFAADGCYSSGWWSDQKDNNKLDFSVNDFWYGSKIFNSKNIQVMVLGLLSQNGYTYNVSFIENIIPDLAKGKTLAESMIGKTIVGNVNIFGDPTFSFKNFLNNNFSG
ncbi:MAG: hypothetical protein QHH15_03875 [Candidatus Thermoplasmatota archaeon]|jgi:hypothetical protein|nr:hypothetical protein [Candidatus Thermoplasmatota archaeon]